MKIILGNDIASYQKDVNFDVYKNNSNFVIIKATEGNGFIDPKFARNQSEARRVSLAVGYYHFARPDLGNAPEVEADFFLKVVGNPVAGEMYVLDYEPKSFSGDAVGWCKRFLDRVYDKIKVRPLIYLNQSQTKGFNWQPVIDGGYGLWIAAYTYDPNNNAAEIGKWPFAAMQQWTNKQSVPGIPVVADGNVFFGDVETFKKYGYQPPTPQPEPTPPTPGPSDEELIKQLRADIARLTKDKEKADVTIQTMTVANGELTENIRQKDREIQQLKENSEQNTSTAVNEALKNQLRVVTPYLFYKMDGGTLIGHGFSKLFGKDITPVDLPEILKGGEGQ